MLLIDIFYTYLALCLIIFAGVLFMAISNVIRRHQEAVTLTRPGAETVVGGYAQEGTPGAFTIQAVVQPLQPKELRNLPPGQNATDWRNVWSLVELRIKDQITILGETFVLQNAVSWQQGGFYQAQGVKVSDII